MCTLIMHVIFHFHNISASLQIQAEFGQKKSNRKKSVPLSSFGFRGTEALIPRNPSSVFIPQEKRQCSLSLLMRCLLWVLIEWLIADKSA